MSYKEDRGMFTYLEMNASLFALFVLQSPILILQDVAVLLVLLYPVAITGKWCMYEVFLVSV